jgi:hypothetical protein
VAGVEGGDEQAEVREDWGEEAEYSDQGIGGGFPWCVSSLSLSLISPILPIPSHTDEFAIYLNYVRKLGFEETPDYDFLRELFTKVLKNSGETEDGVYDWMLLNSGKGASFSSSPLSSDLS